MTLSEQICTGINRSMMLKEKASRLARINPLLKFEAKYGKVRVLVESVFDLQNLLALGLSWKLEDGYSYAAVEDPLLGCDISWKFVREYDQHGCEKLILASMYEAV